MFEIDKAMNTNIYIYKMKNLEIAIYFVVENDKWIEEEGENLKGFGLFVIVQVIGVDSVYIYIWPFLSWDLFHENVQTSWLVHFLIFLWSFNGRQCG